MSTRLLRLLVRIIANVGCMPMALRGLVTKLDGIPDRALLWADLALACLIGLAHGGALALTYAKSGPEADSIRPLASISLPVAAFVLVSSVTALIQASFRRTVLALHGGLFAAAAVVTLVWALSILISGIPQGKFVWSVGMMSALVAYALFVASRYSLPLRFRSRALVLCALCWHSWYPYRLMSRYSSRPVAKGVGQHAT